ncbi:TPA: hypothetical protein ACH3X2_009534 [Trebouxia sp. C0005]
MFVEGHTSLSHFSLQCQEAQLTQMQSSSTLPDRHSFSGSLQPGLPQPELHWTASDGYSTSNSVSQQTVMMEDDQQSNTPLHQQHQPTPQRTHGMSHSNSAPDLRLMLATQLPDSKPLFLPALGSYAGVMVPYKGPEQVIAEAHQHVTSELISRLVDEYHLSHSHPNSVDDGTHSQESAIPEAMDVSEDT